MKKIFLVFTALTFGLILFPAITNAQFAKGDWMVEGGLGSLNLSKTNNQNEQNGNISKSESNDFSISIFPRAGYFVSNNLVVGTTLGIGFGSSKYKNFNNGNGNKSGESTSNLTSLEFVPFVRYYFPGKKATTRFYAQAGGGITLDLSRKYESKSFNNTGDVTGTFKYNYPKKFNNVAAELLVGLNHFVSQNVAINAALGYRYNKSTETISSSNIFGNTTVTSDPTKYTVKTNAFVWNVGFTMFLHCKKKK